MRDTLSPSCLAMEKPPAVLADGVTGITVAGSGGGGGTPATTTGAGAGAGGDGGGGSRAAFAEAPADRSAPDRGFANAVGSFGESSKAVTVASREDGSGGTTMVAARSAVRSASMTSRNGLYSVNTL